MRYSHDSWSIDLPSGWQVEETLEVTAFFHPEGAGAFEVSTFFQEDDPITLEDVKAFAEVDSPEAVKLPYLEGIHAIEQEDGETVFQWWLAEGNQMIYATYVCAIGREQEEAIEREQLIHSLRSLYHDLES